MDFRANLLIVIENIGSFGKKVVELWMTLDTSVVIWHFSQGLPVKVGKDRE